MNWKWAHTLWMLLAAGAEPAYESLQGQPMNKATFSHAAMVWCLAMWTMWQKSPRDGNAPNPPAAQ